MKTSDYAKVTVKISTSYQRGGYGGYGRVGVIVHESDYTPKSIDDRPHAVIEMPMATGVIYMGAMVRSEGSAAIDRAERLARRLRKSIAAQRAADAHEWHRNEYS